METDIFLVGLLLFSIGIWLVWDAFLFYSCRLRSKSYIYLIEGSYPAYEAAMYGIGPSGIGLIILGIGMMIQFDTNTSSLILWYGTAPFVVTDLGLAILQPRWLTPTWLRWIEDYNYDFRSELGEEAWATPDWTQRIRSFSDLIDWVTEIRKKHHQSFPTDSLEEALRHAELLPPPSPPVVSCLLVIAIVSGLGQLWLGSAFVGFLFGGGLALIIYLLYLFRTR